MEGNIKFDFPLLAMLSTIFLSISSIVVFILFKYSKISWRQFIEETKYDSLYNIMGASALLDDIVSREKNKVDLYPQPGKVALITGGTRGIGKEVIKMLLECDIHVVIGCRNVKAGEELLTFFRNKGIKTGNISVFKLDTSSIASVKKFAEQVREKFPKIHMLINNAGIMFGPYRRSEDGYELQFATNYLGHFLLTHLLLDNIKAAGTENESSRIINVTSCAHLKGDINYEDISYKKTPYIPAAAYSQSKIAQVFFTKYLDRVFKSKNIPIEVYSVHPGIVDTDLFEETKMKQLFPWFARMIFKTPHQGAVPIVFACISQDLKNKGGCYISNCEIIPSKDITFFTEEQNKLFDFTMDLLKIEEFGKI